MTTSGEAEKAIQVLKNGGLIGLPTETVYGLAAAIDQPLAIEKIFKVKERPFFDPLIVHVSSVEQAKNICFAFPEIATSLVQKFWPGPLTLVLKSKNVNPMITAGLDTVAVRMPDHPLALKIIEDFGAPLAAPSANKFGKTSPTSAEHVKENFPEIFVVDGGLCKVGLESTVLSLEEGALSILRPGAVTAEMLKEFLRNHKGWSLGRRENRNSPGGLEHHYQPDIPLILFRADQGPSSVQDKISELLKLKNPQGVELKLSLDPKIAARELYGKLRECSHSRADFIYCFWHKEHYDGIWEAITDRITKASTFTV